MFELRRNEVFFSNQRPDEINFKSKKTQKKVNQMNINGEISINLYQEIVDFMDSSDYDAEKDTDDHIQSMINAKLKIAKVYNGLLSTDFEKRIEFLRNSLKNHEFVKNYIKKKGEEKGGLNFAFAEQLRLATEMCELLPVKIGKLRQGIMI
jgi:hypothetical protein